MIFHIAISKYTNQQALQLATRAQQLLQGNTSGIPPETIRKRNLTNPADRTTHVLELIEAANELENPTISGE